MFGKTTSVRCDECRDAIVEVPGGSRDRCWAQALREGWQSFPPPRGEAWAGRRQVCGRCVEYGRPYRDKPLGLLDLGVTVTDEALRFGQHFTPTRRTA